ncbi:MAG: hypothetical protein M3347_11165 [Armatimonadota bacterium]|nr:hypothetical protein [Armatimonadota bacterium]
MEKPEPITFARGETAFAIRLRETAPLSETLDALGLPHPRPALVVVGGAGELDETDLSRLRPLFREALAPVAEATAACVVDGGTDSGIMQLMGQARAAMQANFPLIGVAAVGTVALPDAPPSSADAAPLEPHHTHFVLVPGSQWGDEAPWIARVASAIAEGKPSVTVLINGGEVAWEDVAQSVAAGRFVIVIEGSGRTADQLAAALRGEPGDDRAQRLAASGLLRAVELEEDPTALSALLSRLLS